ncbi:hypothetical protein QJS10_CPA05g02328 [Acorus calamus]|uniref:Signal peptidase complex catalytic subunit SEC11 n=1 Tax=Acorus calamus TaxID=4465 RepID=A0AAV9ERA6_ACOCL|nr:hypothetical protein QJS10_CPA05g02328 [Acorus calamus]
MPGIGPEKMGSSDVEDRCEWLRLRTGKWSFKNGAFNKGGLQEYRTSSGGGGGGTDDMYRQLWLHRHHIVGRAVGFLPYVGWVTLIMSEMPVIKYLVIGALGLFVMAKD